MPVLADPRTIAGPLTAADLAKTRKHSTGRLLPAGCGQSGRYPTRRHPGMVYEPWTDTIPTDWDAACAIEGGQHREPSKTVKATAWTGVALVLLGWPAIAAIVGAVAWVFALA